MISKSSRYVDGRLFQVVDSRTGKFSLAARRKFPPARYVSYLEYTWVDGDEIDHVAHVYLGDPSQWWQVMDANPTIHDVSAIQPGTVIRIPNG